MSNANIKFLKNCQNCKKEFVAQKIPTRYTGKQTLEDIFIQQLPGFLSKSMESKLDDVVNNTRCINMV